MKKLFALFLIVSASLGIAQAEIIENVNIGDYKYYLDTESKRAEVASKGYYSGDITIPSSVEYDNVTYTVTSIGHAAFHSCVNLTSVTLPNSIIQISSSAFQYCIKLVKINIPNSVTTIQQYAFAQCEALPTITIPNSVTSLGANVFYYCKNLKTVTIGSGITDTNIGFPYCESLRTIICHAIVPPEVSEYDFIIDNAGTKIHYSTIVYVPKNSISAYKAHSFWGLYDVRSLDALSAETNEVNITPSQTTADVTWPIVEGADTYDLIIYNESGDEIETYIFNAQGQLQSIILHAPSRFNNQQQTQTVGFSFTITGLDSGTTFSYTLIAKDNEDNILNTVNGSFTTQISMGINDLENEKEQSKIEFRNGQIYILRGDKTYTLQGQEVK